METRLGRVSSLCTLWSSTHTLDVGKIRYASRRQQQAKIPSATAFIPHFWESADFESNIKERFWIRAVPRRVFLAPVAQCLLLVLPMLSFSVVLIVLVYVYDWHRYHSPIEGLSLNAGFYSDVYYVDIPATWLITVASWSSSAVLALMGSFMNLLSYVVATDLIWSSQSSFASMLPQASQLALLIDLLDGKKMAVYQWFMGSWKSKATRTRNLWVIELAVALQASVTALW